MTAINNLKIAICLAGQYRTFDTEIVQRNLKHFLLDRYDCDIYISTWDDRGCSLNSGSLINNALPIVESSITKYVTVKKVEIENYTDWFHQLPPQYQALIQTSGVHANCIPQLYKKYKVSKLISDDKEYDLVISTRPDLLFFDDLKLDNYLGSANTIWNCNPKDTWAYYPNRIFDILFLGSTSSIKKISECYYHIHELLDDPYNTGLGSLDCCKMLYTYAKKYCNLLVESTPTLVGNVYRDEQSLEYNLQNCNITLEQYKKHFNL